MTAELMKLAEKVESLTGPDREVDARIACFLDNRTVHDIVDGKILGRNNRPPHDICIVNWAPHYTSSLDAAMSLIPERSLWSVCDMEDGPYAQVIRPMPNGGYVNGLTTAKGSTAALALCAAALKARALARDERGER